MTRLATTFALTFALLSASFASAQQFPQIRYRFGMQVSLTGNGNVTGLYINSTTPGGPADQAGLIAGDVIVLSNGWNFQQAFTDADAVRTLQSSVSSGGGIPTVAANNGGLGHPHANLVVIRNGQQISGTVFPIDIGRGIPTDTTPVYPPVVLPPCHDVGHGGGGSCSGGNSGGIPTL